MLQLRVFLLVLALVTVPCALNGRKVQGGSTLLRIVPPPIEVTVGQTFTVSIDIYDVVELAAYDFKVSWDTQFVDYVAYTHTPPWSPSFPAPPPIIGDSYIIFSAAALSPPYFAGSATLATVTFTALQSGDTYIRFAYADFADGSGTPIILITEDAAITILPPEHDVAVTGIHPAKRAIGQGYSATVRVTAANPGDFPEAFNVTLYANDTVIAQHPVTLASGAATSLTFTWNTEGYAMGNYSLWASAAPVAGETAVDDNTVTDGWVAVTIPGDVDGDRDVDIFDLVKMAQVYGTVEGHLLYTARCDIDDDGDVDLFDLVAAAVNYGRTW